MGAGADDRLRGGLLAGLALGALVAGGWWWREATPATGPVAAPLSSAPPTLAPADPPSAEHFVVVDPDGGRVIQGSGPGPDESVVLHQESGAAAPLVPDTVWADRSHLAPADDPLIRQSASSDGERYLLVVTCSGSGTLTVSVSGSREDGPPARVVCSGAPTTLPVTGAGGPLRVRFAVADGEVDLDARLASLR